MSAACPTTEHLRPQVLYNHPKVCINITNLFFLAPLLQPGEIPFSQALLACPVPSDHVSAPVLQFVKIPPALGLGLEGVPKAWDYTLNAHLISAKFMGAITFLNLSITWVLMVTQIVF